MWAILSDIHSNFEAFRAVMDDIDQHDVDRVIILGDIVGWGPQPIECIDMARFFGSLVLTGFMERCLFAPELVGGRSFEQSISWTKEQLRNATKDRESRWEFLANLPQLHKEDSFLFLTGSPRNPIHEFLYPEDISNRRKMTRVFSCMDQYCFNGNTHRPGIFVENGNEKHQFFDPDDISFRHRLDSRKTNINVGSVGQPADLDPRACYVLFDGETVLYRRIPYDIEATVRLIYSIPDLENFLGDRLWEGR